MTDTIRPPLDGEAKRWLDPDDYSHCQDLAASVREAGGQAIRARSARDPHGTNLALLDPAGFAKSEPDHGQGWHLRHEGDRLTAIAAFPHAEVLAFTPGQFGLPERS